MRTFIAIPLSTECRQLLSTTQEKLRTFDADVRWVSIESIHLTLKFLGEIDAALVPELAATLRSTTGPVRTFNLSISGLGGFPNLRSPRVIWCGLGGDLETLAALQRQVEEACGPLGFQPEDRPFHPHLTLGRVQGKRNLQPLLDYIRIASQPETAFTAAAFNIYKSDLRPRGAVYTVLETIRFEA
jgi:RNA 2',3'-cyclic 3'-phosphodiesterase